MKEVRLVRVAAEGRHVWYQSKFMWLFIFLLGVLVCYPYSVGTMTSLGAAGITPASSEARLLTIIESLLGVLFLAVLISRLMSAYGSRRLPAVTEE